MTKGRDSQRPSADNCRCQQFSLGRWLDAQAIRSPTEQLDSLLIIIRWGIILTAGLMSFLNGFQASTLAPPPAIFLAVLAYNLPISYYAWRRRVLSEGRVGWLLLADLSQAVLTVILTGGYYSFYFALFLLVMAELALAFPWRVALALAVTTGALEVGAMTCCRTTLWESVAAYLVVGKFSISLLVTGLVMLFGELVRREDVARQRIAYTAEHLAALNAVFVQLGESALDLERTLAAILHGTRSLPNALFGLILLPGEREGTWYVGASNSERHPLGEKVTDFKWDIIEWPFSLCKASLPAPLSSFVISDPIARLMGTVLHSPTGETLGLLMVGWKANRLPDSSERTFLQALTLEAGLALRNAHLYAQEQEHVARLQRFEKLQSTFFSAIGHELKTPLTVLKMLMPSLHHFTELPTDTRDEITETMELNLDRLETLISDLLESTRLEAGALALYPGAVNLIPLTKRVLDRMFPLFSHNHRRAVLEASPDLPLVWADSRRVEQILSNLLSNAAKFAPPDTVVEVQIIATENALQTCIADAGPGVRPAERERIFEKFYTTPGNPAHESMGLGLYICRELVRLHNGRIWVEDRPGGGSRFCFTLPIFRERETDAEKSRAQDPDH